MNKATRNVLREAKAAVTRHWFKGYTGVPGAHGMTYDDGGEGEPVCAMLAVMYAGKQYSGQREEVNWCSALSLLEEELGIDGIHDTVAKWNNQPERTKEEVIDLFDRVLMKGTPVEERQTTTEREMAYTTV